MNHRKSGRKLARTSAHRKALLRNMVTSLLEHEQIRTTDAKAKELAARFKNNFEAYADVAPKEVIESGKTTRVNLETPVTVMLLYWTTDVAEDGTVLQQFAATRVVLIVCVAILHAGRGRLLVIMYRVAEQSARALACRGRPPIGT